MKNYGEQFKIITETKYNEEGIEKTYLHTTGMVEIYTPCEGCDDGTKTTCEYDDCNRELIIYYPEDILDDIYNNEYKNAKNSTYEEQALKYLRKCYTYTIDENGKDVIKMYSQELGSGIIRTWEYADETELGKNTKFESYKRNSSERAVLNNTQGISVQAQYIQFSDQTSEYATPMEFMVDLLEVSQSKEFVNAFINKNATDNYIKLQLYKKEHYNQIYKVKSALRNTKVVLKRKSATVQEGYVLPDYVEHSGQSDVQEVQLQAYYEYSYDIGIFGVKTWYGTIAKNKTRYEDFIIGYDNTGDGIWNTYFEGTSDNLPDILKMGYRISGMQALGIESAVFAIQELESNGSLIIPSRERMITYYNNSGNLSIDLSEFNNGVETKYTRRCGYRKMQRRNI